MPDNVLENLAPCSKADSTTYWASNTSVDPAWSNPSAEPYLSIPVNLGPGAPLTPTPPSAVVGSVLPLRRAEELIATLPGVMSVRIIPGDTGAIDEIHVLTTSEVAPKHTVRNIESALMAQLGLRINHRKVSIAQSLDPARAADSPTSMTAGPATGPMATIGVASASYVPFVASSTPSSVAAAPLASMSAPTPSSNAAVTPLASDPVSPVDPAALNPDAIRLSAGPTADARLVADVPVDTPRLVADALAEEGRSSPQKIGSPSEPSARPFVPKTSSGFATAFTPASDTRLQGRRVLIFEDVEVRRSRTRGVLCKVTLSRGGEEFFGESEGQESERSRIELAARATVLAIMESVKATTGGDRLLALEGSKLIEAFDREFVFVSVLARMQREPAVLTGSCEVRESPETSAVLAVLDATNRWLYLDR